MANAIEQRTCIRFGFRNTISATKIFETLQKAYKCECLPKPGVFEWYKLFQRCKNSLVNESHSGRPFTLTNHQQIDYIRELELNHHCLVFKDINEQISITFGSCQQILRVHFCVWIVISRVVPKCLNLFQKQQRTQIKFFKEISS